MKEIYRLIMLSKAFDISKNILPPFLYHVYNILMFYIISTNLDNKIHFSRRCNYLKIHKHIYNYDDRHILIRCSREGYLSEVKIILESCNIENLSYSIINAMIEAGLNYQKKTFLFLLRYIEKYNIAISKDRICWWLGISNKYLKYV